MAGKDNRWLQLEVCRQFLRDQCSRTDLECRFAHPPSTVDSSNGTVTACFDFLRKRCRRENCKYFHPPEHIVNQLVSTGSNFAPPASSEVSFEPSSAMGRQDKSDRLEVCREYLRHTCQRPDDQCRYAHPPEHISVDTRDHTVIVCMDYMKGRCSREKCRYYHPLPHLQSKVKQQQVSTSSSMLMEQILLNNQRKRPSSTPADALSHDYRRTALPYSGQGAAAAAAAAAASAAAASAANPYGAAANPYDPATLAAYGGNSQAQQMMMAAALLGLSGGTATADPYAQYAAAAAAAAAASAAVASNSYGWLGQTGAMASPAAFVPEPVALSALGTAATSALSASSSGAAGDTLPLCMDFRMGKCQRRTCKYAHPPDHVTVDNKTVRICRDHQRGQCRRPECRFYHVPSDD